MTDDGPPDEPEVHVAQAVPPETADNLIEAVHEDGRVPPEAIAEQVLGYMLIFARKLHVGQHQQHEGRWLRSHGEELRGRYCATDVQLPRANAARAFGRH